MSEGEGTRLLDDAVQKAVKLEKERADRAITLAVEAAEFRATTKATLAQHEKRLDQINGSIISTGVSFADLKKHIEKRDKLQEERNIKWDTEQALHWRDKGQAFNKKKVYTAYAALFATVAAPAVAELIKTFGG